MRAPSDSVTERKPETILREVSAAVALVEGEAGVRDVLGVVARLEPVGVRRISRAAELPVPIVAAVCAELRKRGVIARERPVQLTPSGRSLFGFDTAAFPRSGSWSLEPAGDPIQQLDEVADQLAEAAAAAPAARVEIDQAHCTVATKLRRVLLMHESGALLNRRLVLLGDDDLISVTIHHLARHFGFGGRIGELVVVDIDAEVLEFCRAQLADAAFPIRFFHHDLRRPLPKELIGAADTILTDPPYTPQAAELFLSRAASALASRSGGNTFFCFGMKRPQASLRIQSAIVSMGFVVRQLIRNFNEYLGAGALGGSSHLYHLTSTNQTKPLVDTIYSGRLYTGERVPARRYRCAACGAIEEVGPHERLRTIAELQAQRCPACGGRAFRPLPRSTSGSYSPHVKDGSDTL